MSHAYPTATSQNGIPYPSWFEKGLLDLDANEDDAIQTSTTTTTATPTPIAAKRVRTTRPRKKPRIPEAAPAEEDDVLDEEDLFAQATAAALNGNNATTRKWTSSAESPAVRAASASTASDPLCKRKQASNERSIEEFSEQIVKVLKFYALVEKKRVWVRSSDTSHVCDPSCYERFDIAILLRDVHAEHHYNEHCDRNYHVHTESCNHDLQRRNRPRRGIGHLGQAPARGFAEHHLEQHLICESHDVYACHTSFRLHFCGARCNMSDYSNTTEAQVCNISGMTIESTVNFTASDFPTHGGFSLTNRARIGLISPEKRMAHINQTLNEVYVKFAGAEIEFGQALRLTCCVTDLESLGVCDPRKEWLFDCSVFDALVPFLRNYAGIRTDRSVLTCNLVFKRMRLACWNVLFSAQRSYRDLVEACKGFSAGVAEREKYIKAACKSKDVMFVPEMNRILRARSKCLFPWESNRIGFTRTQKERIVDYYSSMALQVYTYVSLVQCDIADENLRLVTRIDDRATTSSSIRASSHRRYSKFYAQDIPSTAATSKIEDAAQEAAVATVADFYENVLQCFAPEFLLAVMYRCSVGGIQTSSTHVNSLVKRFTDGLDRFQNAALDAALIRNNIVPDSDQDPRRFRDLSDVQHVLPYESLLFELLPNQSTIDKYREEYARKKINTYTHAITDMVATFKKIGSLRTVKLVFLNVESVLSARQDADPVHVMLQKSYERMRQSRSTM